MNQIICIVGPTASGKSDLSVRLAEYYHTEIISADSVQVYKDLNIGSAKLTDKEMKGIKHHMIDVVDINTPSYSVSLYYKSASKIIDDLLNEHRIPIIVGGSGLYLSSLTKPLNFAVPVNIKTRKELEEKYSYNPSALFDMLKEVDFETAKRLHINDEKRIVRALEVYLVSGKPFSSFGNDFQNTNKKQSKYNALQIGIMIDRKVLYDRINARVDMMFEQGLLQEAKQIYEIGYDRSLPAMQSIGYKQLFEYFDGLISLNEAIERIKIETRHYAKRQMTWFKRDENIHWVNGNYGEVELFQQCLTLCNKLIERKAP